MKRNKVSAKKNLRIDALQDMARKAIHARQYDDAGQYLDEALEINPRDAQTLALRGMTLFWQNDLQQAIGYSMLAVQYAPQEFRYKQGFIALASPVKLGQANPHFEKALIACCDDPRVDCTTAWSLWGSMLMTQPGFKEIFKVSEVGDIRSFDKEVFNSDVDFSPLLSPLFLKGLRRIVVYGRLFEDFLTALRAALIADLDRAEKIFLPEAHAALSVALSFYCFNTEYIFDVTEEEKSAAEKLRRQVETDENVSADASRVALCACYSPLYALANAQDIARRHAHSAARDVVQTQISAWDRIKKAASEVAALTEISDDVSMRVRVQYEESPYPQVISFVREIINEDVPEASFAGQAAQVLVAGCGTGREAFELASIIPDAKVLAVDLSRTSLAYATLKAEEFGLGNVTFRQADILKLAALEQRFDFISCGGVLHHMKDPVAGWKVLKDLLKADGLMRIGLYSELGRAAVVKAREIIARGGYDSTPEGMRRFRRDCRGLLDPESYGTITACWDFYHMSRLRDYLFHAQEHRFGLPQIKHILQDLGLELTGFNISEEVRERYRKENPDDTACLDLDRWYAFEQKYPDTFGSMYQFFCRAAA